MQAVGTLVAAHTLLLDLVKPPLRKWPGGRWPPPTHPQKPLRLPFNPTTSLLLSPFLPLVEVQRLVWTRRVLGADVCPVRPLGTCRAPAHLLLKSPFTPTNLPAPTLPPPSLPHLLPHHSLPSFPISPHPLLPRCAGAGLRQVDCRGTIPSPHGRRTLTVACRPPASVLPPLVQLARVAKVARVASWKPPTLASSPS